MKFIETNKVEELIKEILWTGKNKNNLIIEDITEEQAFSLFEKYGNYGRILTVLPQNLLSNKKFVIKCMEEYNIVASPYADESLFKDLEYSLVAIKNNNYAMVEMVNQYENLPKEENFLIPVIKEGILRDEHFEIEKLIDKILGNKDLTEYQKALSKLKSKLTSINENKIVWKKGFFGRKKLNEVIKIVIEIDEHLLEKQKAKNQENELNK